MIRGLVEAMIGDAGASALRYYEAHALVLGLIIVVYGFVMYWSWSNLVRVYRYLVAAAAATLTPGEKTAARPHGRSAPGSAKPKSGHGRVELPWQAAVDSVNFPFVARRAGLLPMRKSVASARSIIDERELWEHARLVANGADVRRVAPEYRLMGPRQVEKDGKD